MMIDTRESEILERLSPKRVDQLLQCGCSVEAPVDDAIEQFFELLV